MTVMPSSQSSTTTPGAGAAKHLEKLAGVVERITFHNAENGWTVLKVSPFREPGRLATVLIHQAKVFAGATMEFWGSWSHHPKHGEQFKAEQAIEKKPASSAALEKYLGSGLIRGVGPATAKKIVSYFKDKTLEVFENQIDELLKVPGIADKKLEQIKDSWQEHRSIRDVMLFLQNYGISTLFAVKIFKAYGNKAIEIVSSNPYRLAHDIYGIGFFSADKIALKMGFARDGEPRIEAGIKHVLSASREEGHCYLTEGQIIENTLELLGDAVVPERILSVVGNLLQTDQIKCRRLPANKAMGTNVNRSNTKTRPRAGAGVGTDTDTDMSGTDTTTRHGASVTDAAGGEEGTTACYYSKSLYFDELLVARRVKALTQDEVEVDSERVRAWVDRYCEKNEIQLSDEQHAAVLGIVGYSFSILTGGPGCGKTTTTRALVNLLIAMRKRVLLAAPTGRAAQRMTEVIGSEAKTLHRLLEWAPEKAGFKKNEEEPLAADFLVIDECSMLDISLAASVFKAVPQGCQVLFIGDPDQLPAVGAGDVLQDFLKVKEIPRYRLTKIFRQAEKSSIIRYAHEINAGHVPRIQSPLARPQAFAEGVDCLFIDSDEATQEQIKFLARAKYAIQRTLGFGEQHAIKSGESWIGLMQRDQGGGTDSSADASGGEGNRGPAGITIKKDVDAMLFPEQATADDVRTPVLSIPERFKHVDLEKLAKATNGVDELRHILKSVHPWSSLHYGLTAVDTVLRLYTKSIREWLGPQCEVQVLTPQVRGTLGTVNLNTRLQQVANPPAPGKKQIQIGERILRVGDRVIQTRNNYDLGIFNGDIGTIVDVETEELGCQVRFSGPEGKIVAFKREDLNELVLAYAITVHKSQGSEFEAVIIPVASQHFNMLFRNLIYTGLTRAKKLAIFVGSRKAFAMAIHQADNRKRQTALAYLLDRAHAK